MYFINAQNSQNTLLCASKDAHLNNCSNNTLCTEISSIVLLFENSSRKVPRLFFIFVRVSTGHTNFLSSKIHILFEPERPTLVFFNCRTSQKSTRKVRLKVGGETAHLVFDWEKKLIFKPKLTCA